MNCPCDEYICLLFAAQDSKVEVPNNEGKVQRVTATNRLSRRDEATERLMTRATITVYDVMALTGWGETTVRRAIASGDIATIRLGHRIHVLSAPLRRQLGIEG